MADLRKPKKYYAVNSGRNPGIYTCWDDCKEQVTGFSGAKYKSFPMREQAENYMNSAFLSVTKEAEPTLSTENIAKIQQILLESSQGQQYDPISRDISKTTILTAGSALPNELISEETLIGYTDGSCVSLDGKLKGDGVGGSGIVLLRNDLVLGRWAIGSPEYPTTNNRAELNAIFMLLTFVSSLSFSTLVIRTDSQYSINALTRWISNWKKNNWRKSNGEVVLNKFLLGSIDNMIEFFKRNGKEIRFEHVYGHRGDKYNEEADFLANDGRESMIPFIRNK